MATGEYEEVVSLLSELLEEIRGLRSDFADFTGHNVDSMAAISDRILEGITGQLSGIGGSDLNDLSIRLDAIHDAVTVLEDLDLQVVTGRAELGKVGKDLEDIHTAIIEQTEVMRRPQT